MEIAENIIIIVDNSEFQIKTEVSLTLRWAQQNAVKAICKTVLESNPNSQVGVVTLCKSRTLVKLNTISNNHINLINKRVRSLKGDRITSLAKALGLAREQFRSHLNLEHKDYIILFVGATVVFDDAYLDICAHYIKADKIKVSAITFGVNCIITNGIPNFIKKIQESSGYGSCMVVCIITEPLTVSKLIRDRNGEDTCESKDNLLFFEIIFDINKYGQNVFALEPDVYFPIVYQNTIYYSPMQDCKYFLSYGKFIEAEGQYVKFCRFELPPINEDESVKTERNTSVPEKITFLGFEIKAKRQG